jgi:hypothetical protein
MFTQPVFWPWFAGLVFITVGLVAFRKQWLAARGLDKLIVLGQFLIAPLLRSLQGWP